ncbi:hypothetical protein [Leptospira kanakyensis]|uniref:Uncharacterized protein n=1 Tax=Leptospira kanakyensis TaxID=2484968 RepID=A0A6N4PU05_9LEPT|nr:hypothetical protein [Leptospira kanakyensis]MCW7470145.1 hypothetical protein [Leptospira kanakyensis]MCW7481125.1 hypothetical protein [Leptospira kanakyensis]TGK47900.1 hypothetical protein EHQ11_18505 [Leptospira kanakyensis]TGK63092.1 hypothetical protein EHQ16_01080 [Leptospira kanakyensis]TGK66698.1 hypothetical protein EHQ18_16315 [Leptospira kanakyensis]
MNTKWFYILLVFSALNCSKNNESEKKNFKILRDAFHNGQLSFVQTILLEIKEERELTEEESLFYFKTLFYSGKWKELFLHWTQIHTKTPEMVLLYFKAVLISKESVLVSPEDEKKLLELLPISPEACLLYLKFQKKGTSSKQKKLFLAQGKLFQTHIDRLVNELGELK